MENSRIVAGLVRGERRLFFKDDDFIARISLNEIVCGGEADYAASDYDYVARFHFGR